MNVRLYAAQAVYAIANLARDAVPVLLACLSDDDAGVRAAAAEVLGDIGSVVREVDRKAVPKLVELLKDREETVRRAAADALKKIDPRALPARR